MNITLEKVFVVILIVSISLGFLGGCAMVISAIGSDHSPEAKAALITAETKQEIKTEFSIADLPPHFLLVIGNVVYDFRHSYSDILSLERVLESDMAKPQGFWLISPFYQPREYFFKEFDLSKPIDLAKLTAEIPYDAIETKKINPTLTEAGPFTAASVKNSDSLYYWYSDNDLIIPSPPRRTGLISTNPDKPINLAVFSFLNPHSISFSPQSDKIAYVDRGYLVITSTDGKDLGKWALTTNPDQQNHTSFSTDFISWSPNGRYIVGSNESFSEHYLHKLWVLDLKTGSINGFNALKFNKFIEPVWSPDGNQLIVSEYVNQNPEMIHSQWTLLDMRSKKLIFVAAKTKANLNYNFIWDSQSKLSTTINPLSRVEVLDPIRNLEQTEFSLMPKDGKTFLGTQLRILNEDCQETYRIDLKAPLEESGLELEQVQTLYIYPIFIDSRNLYLRVKASTVNNGRIYTSYGKVDLDLGIPAFLNTIWSRQDEGIPIPDRIAIHNHRIIDITDQKSINVIDLDKMSMSKKALNEQLLYACWYNDKILYVTTSGIYFFDQALEAKSVSTPLFKTGTLEKLDALIKLSPNGRYLAIPRKKNVAPNIDTIHLLIVDLFSS